MLKIAVVTRYFPSSAEPWQGRSAYQALRVLAQGYGRLLRSFVEGSLVHDEKTQQSGLLGSRSGHA
jgi:hypothetical protein